jgi:hypothetical protein
MNGSHPNEAKGVFRSPLLHILVLGALIAVVILVVKGPPTGDEATRVVVTGADLMQLRAGFMRTWQREPTDAELRGELEKFIRQEVLYREALARGYDRDDIVVRRAMQQKMEFLAASQAIREPPTEEEIEAFFSLRQERYRSPAVLDIAQVYVSQDARGVDAQGDAEALLERLRRENPEPQALAEYGDPIMLPPIGTGLTEQDLKSTFGEEFAAAVLELPTGVWEGPVRSGYGLHLVFVAQKQESRIPEWRNVAPRVINDMEFEARTASREQLYQEIVQNYQIMLDRRVRELLESAAE